MLFVISLSFFLLFFFFFSALSFLFSFFLFFFFFSSSFLSFSFQSLAAGMVEICFLCVKLCKEFCKCNLRGLAS